MDQELNSKGICSTCNFFPECHSYKNSQKIGKAVLHCEAFDNSTATMEEKNKGRDLLNSSEAKGLCLNCDNAESCKLPGFSDEVVFCEEHSSKPDNECQDRPSHKVFAHITGLGIKNLIPGWDL